MAARKWADLANFAAVRGPEICGPMRWFGCVFPLNSAPLPDRPHCFGARGPSREQTTAAKRLDTLLVRRCKTVVFCAVRFCTASALHDCTTAEGTAQIRPLALENENRLPWIGQFGNARQAATDLVQRQSERRIRQWFLPPSPRWFV